MGKNHSTQGDDKSVRKHSRKHSRKGKTDEDRREEHRRKKYHHRKRSVSSEKDTTGAKDAKRHNHKSQHSSRSADHNHDNTSQETNRTLSQEDQLDADRDYFAYHNHLRLYLLRNKNIYFEDLNSLEARQAFEEFCREYNNRTLKRVFYDSKQGSLIQALDQCKRTRYAWKFHTSESEKKTLHVVKDGVRKQTEYENLETRTVVT